MLNKIYQINMFNEALDHLFNYLIDTFPLYASDVLLSKSTLSLIKQGNPRLVMEQFMEFIEPYKSEILECNEDFFINFDKNCAIPNQHLMYGFKLKGIWESAKISDMQKARIWLYFHKLIAISVGGTAPKSRHI